MQIGTYANTNDGVPTDAPSWTIPQVDFEIKHEFYYPDEVQSYPEDEPNIINAFQKLLPDGTDCFPFSSIKLGMRSFDLLDLYPSKDMLIPKYSESGTLERGLVFYGIYQNIYWDAIAVFIQNEVITSISYFKNNMDLLEAGNIMAYNFDDTAEKVKPLFEQLRRELGNDFEKKITYGQRTKERSPMYVWERENDVVAFTHSPISKMRKGMVSETYRFDFELTMADKIENMHGMFSRMATNNLPEDVSLWAEAMGEENDISNAIHIVETSPTNKASVVDATSSSKENVVFEEAVKEENNVPQSLSTRHHVWLLRIVIFVIVALWVLYYFRHAIPKT